MFRPLRPILNLRSFGFRGKNKPLPKTNKFFKNTRMSVETLEDRTTPAAFTPGDLLVLQTDPSAVTSNTTFSIVELDPSTAAQTPSNTIAIDGTGANALRISGSATSTGYLATTDDGSLLTFNAVNTTDTTSNVNSQNPRGVGTLDAS